MPGTHGNQEGNQISGTGVKDGGDLACGYRRLNPNPPEEQPVILTTELSL